MSPEVAEAVENGFSSRHEALFTAAIGIQSHNLA